MLRTAGRGAWRVVRTGAYRRGMRAVERQTAGDDVTPLANVLAQFPGRWVAVDRRTNEPRAAADTPDKLAVEIRRLGLRNVTVVRAPDPSEPELVGLG